MLNNPAAQPSRSTLKAENLARFLIIERRQHLKEKIIEEAIELLWQSGQKQQALSLCKELVAVLSKEYGITPAAEINDMYKKIQYS